MITLAVNELIEDLTNNKIYRLLWIDETNTTSFVIDVESSKALPMLLKIRDLTQGVLEGIYVKVETQNGNQQRISRELTDKEREIRDNAWDLIKDLVQNVPSIFISELRGKEVKKLESEKQFAKATLYKYLRRYWQGGMTTNCLVPNYRNSGARGKTRKSGEKKRGRPRLGDTVGINVTKEITDIFRKAIKRYYLTDKKNTLTFTYKMMIKEFYAGEVRYENGLKYISILDENSIPTMAQFKYWYEKEFDIEQVVKKRDGIKSFERNNRAILGSSTYEALGPGSRYQIDATVADVYLISSYNSDWIVGRPIIYFVIDVYSHLITGMYIGFEGPSWAGIMMAIANAASDKKEFCNSYGINISNEWWPSAHLPEIILGDRGELEGYSVNSLINGLNISIENTPSFRPDWKGIVEKLFDTTQERIKSFLPGYIQTDFGERGAKDYRLEAKLTLEQYTKIIINFVLYYNKNYFMKNYIRDTGMIEDNVKPTPIELWKWGIHNRAGKLRKADSDTIRFYLMPRDKATVTSRGIKFKGMLYSCELAIKESWFVNARINKSWKVEISYDPRNMDNIYLHTNKESMFEVCSLLEHQERFKGKVIDEIEQLTRNERNDYKKEEHAILQEEVNLFGNIEAIVTESIQIANQTQSKNITKAKKTKSIRENRQVEKALQREQESFQLGIQLKNNQENIIDLKPNELDANTPETSLIKELFNKRRGMKRNE
ncbi:Mu transposase C-terminal domain-containing protein [Lysinibacillus capsici]|uniref:Mu transposase C-terminal domain-containing protein n=1 Tax=Lysinibacillus capsici TaxID=2115968 RepID=UPI00029CA7C3|nr:Mu transposase C-terminal domain-containing protein [Lysinibacillus capsici]EKU44047.1 Tn7-like transposition protein B [Lysinibacillus fusiformis ZB2]MBU5252657.1 Mu transposase C-terminal domain-containing protein [Lysinibacillus capsici]